MKRLSAAIAALAFVFALVGLDSTSTAEAGYKSYGSSSYGSSSYGSKSYSSGSKSKSYNSGSKTKSYNSKNKSYNSSSKSSYSRSKVRNSSTFKNTVGSKRYTTKQLRQKRQSYFDRNQSFHNRYQRYDSWGWSQPSFGGFNTGFLMAMMMSDNPGEMMFWQSVTGDPWVATFITNAREEAKEKGDQEALQKIKQVEETVENNEGSDVSTEKALQQADVPAEVAFHEDTLTKDKGPNVLVTVIGTLVGAVALGFMGFVIIRMLI